MLVKNVKMNPATVTTIQVGDVVLHIQRLYDRNKSSSGPGKAPGGDQIVVKIDAPRDQKITFVEVPISRES